MHRGQLKQTSAVTLTVAPFTTSRSLLFTVVPCPSLAICHWQPSAAVQVCGRHHPGHASRALRSRRGSSSSSCRGDMYRRGHASSLRCQCPVDAARAGGVTVQPAPRQGADSAPPARVPTGPGDGGASPSPANGDSDGARAGARFPHSSSVSGRTPSFAPDLRAGFLAGQRNPTAGLS